MAIAIGSRFGAYEIVAPLGAGGMSRVYRARDESLGRDVAVKVLPEDVARDPERLARFEREAKLLASLSHPNIAVIHGLERDAADELLLVLELVPGPTLHERLGSGPLSLEEAVSVFLQIARALEAAHDKGIIHRDLKPDNVKITESGMVKLLDFGLGKSIAISPGAPQAHTATYDGTHSGMILGTPGYMSPEQARGFTVAKRTDIWSFGVCLYEALSGSNPFGRPTVPDTLAAILNDEPDWGKLPGSLPPGLSVLLDRCLKKDEKGRLHDIADARIELEDVVPTRPAGPGRPNRTNRRTGRTPGRRLTPSHSGPLAWTLAAASALLAVGLFAWGIGRQPRTARPNPPLRRFTIALPITAPLSLETGGAIAVSPDGTRIAYVARRGDESHLYMRSLDELDTRLVPGTTGALAPFFSSDSQWLGFFSGGKLKKLPLLGGGAIDLTETLPGGNARGGAWLAESPPRIVFAPSSQSGLALVPEEGGPTTPVTQMTPAGPDISHRWPSPLPGGKSILFTVWREKGFDVALARLDRGSVTTLVRNASYPRYVSTGHLLFVRDGNLMAVAFDPARGQVGSEAVALVEGIAFDRTTGAAFYDVSEDGALFYAASPPDRLEESARPLLLDRQGRARPIAERRRSFEVPRLSPDGASMLTTIDEAGELSDVWSLDLERGTLTRLTLDGASGAAIWTPDGRRITFSSEQQGSHFAIHWMPADGSGAVEQLVPGVHPEFPTSWSRDGKVLAFTELDPETKWDVSLFTLENRKRTKLLGTRYNEAGAVFSPDGRHLAYVSDESGREQVYVRAFPGPEGKWPISPSIGNEPVWSADGKELFFRSGSALMSVAIESEPGFRASSPRVVFEAPFDAAGILYANYDVSADGEHFVMVRSEQDSFASELQVVLHWFQELERRVPITNGAQ